MTPEEQWKNSIERLRDFKINNAEILKQLDSLKEEVAVAANLIKSEMALSNEENKEILSQHFCLKAHKIERNSFNSTQLKNDIPEIYSKYLTKTNYIKLLTKEAK